MTSPGTNSFSEYYCKDSILVSFNSILAKLKSHFQIVISLRRLLVDVISRSMNADTETTNTMIKDYFYLSCQMLASQ